VNLYGVKIKEPLNAVQFKQKLQLLPPERQHRINRYKYIKDAQLSLIAGLLLSSIIQGELGIPYNQQCFEYNSSGKPRLITDQPYHFNLSHSVDWVVCGTDHNPVGIDIEQIRPINLRIAKRVMNDHEYKTFSELSPEEKITYFYDIWTMKESYVKAIGKGLSFPLDYFSIESTGEEFIIRSNDLPDYWTRQIEIDPKYKLSVCALHADIPSNIIMVELKKL
jgi:4'-phosphopantetheinyl transferase